MSSSTQDARRAAFAKALEDFFSKNDRELKEPILARKPLDLYTLWRLVRALGGRQKVIDEKQWARVGRAFNPPKSHTSLSTDIKRQYDTHLWDFDKALESGEIPPWDTGLPPEVEGEGQALLDELSPGGSSATARKADRPGSSAAAVAGGSTQPGSPVSGRGAASKEAGSKRKAVAELPSSPKSFAKRLAAEAPAGEDRGAAGGVPAETVAAEDVVGRRVRVWWPLDAAYYSGKVVTYNAASASHTVQYDDGDREDVTLNKEKWHWSTPQLEAEDINAPFLKGDNYPVVQVVHPRGGPAAVPKPSPSKPKAATAKTASPTRATTAGGPKGGAAAAPPGRQRSEVTGEAAATLLAAMADAPARAASKGNGSTTEPISSDEGAGADGAGGARGDEAQSGGTKEAPAGTRARAEQATEMESAPPKLAAVCKQLVAQQQERPCGAVAIEAKATAPPGDALRGAAPEAAPHQPIKKGGKVKKGGAGRSKGIKTDQPMLEGKGYQVFRAVDPPGFEVFCLLPGLQLCDVKVRCWQYGRLLIEGRPSDPSVTTFWGVRPASFDISLPSTIVEQSARALMTLHGQLYIRVVEDHR